MEKVLYLLSLFLFVALAGEVRANEGTFVLKAEQGFSGECFVASVFVDSDYKILATCRNLPVALGPENTLLILWRDLGEGKFARIGELRRGKLTASVRDKFDHLLVTSEAKSSGNVPQGPILAQGSLSPIDFDGVNGSVLVKPTAVVTPTVTAAVSENVSASTQQATSKIGSIFAGIAKAVALGFVLLLVVVGVLGFMARRKGL